MNKKAHESDEIKADGSFKRQASLFSTRFGMKANELPVEKNRYRLIWASPCPWSHRAVIVRKLLGLDKVISLGEVGPIRPHKESIDWAFTLDENEVDPVLNIKYLSDIYKKTNPTYKGRPTVPAVIDVKTNQLVNNDYFTLTIDFSVAWQVFHKENAPILYPEHLRDEIDELNDLIYKNINNGVYECGFARTQKAYEEAYDKVFSYLDLLEERLESKRFLLGDFITEADIRLYVTLIRFDVAYYSVFKVNKYRLIDYPNLWGYVRDLYHTDGFFDTTNFEAIKQHYYISARLSPGKSPETIIVPKGPNLSSWEETADRYKLSQTEEKFLI